jgi:hypothetical protein
MQVKKEIKKLNRAQRLVVKTFSSTSNKNEEKKFSIAFFKGIF